MITLLQAGRLVTGIIFIVLYSRRVLPGNFAIYAAGGDLVLGAIAPFGASILLSTVHFRRRTFVSYHVLGILDNTVRVILRTLTSATSWGFLAGEITSRVMTVFPLSLVPVFFLPLTVLLNIIALLHVQRRKFGESAAQSNRSRSTR